MDHFQTVGHLKCTVKWCKYNLLEVKRGVRANPPDPPPPAYGPDYCFGIFHPTLAADTSIFIMTTIICEGVISAASQSAFITIACYIIKKNRTSASPKVSRAVSNSTCLVDRKMSMLLCIKKTSHFSTLDIIPVVENPSCLQATLASILDQ